MTKHLFLFSFLLLSACFATLAVAAQSVALVPVDRQDNWWQQRHAGNVERIEQGNVNLLMIGDSITQGWDGHRELWEQTFGKYNPVNMGFSGDRTEHVLWRLDHLPLDRITPKGVVIMIGTNNIGHGSSTPTETAQGIKAIVDKLQKQYPDIKILLLHVFPRDQAADGRFRVMVNAINAYLPELFKDEEYKNVTLLDIGPKFLAEDKTLPLSVMPDQLHLNADGYRIWADAMVEPLAELMK